MGDVGAETESKRSKNFIWWVQAIAVGVYLALLAFAFVYIRKPPAADTVTCVGGYIACLDLDQIGDVFAGVFAPLAFFWLVAAVWLQSEELHHQRKAADEQSKALKVQIDHMEKQTDVLDRQLKTFSNTEVKLLIDQLHVALYERINNRIKTAPEGQPVLHVEPNFLVDDALHKISEALCGWVAINGEEVRTGQIRMSQADKNEFANIRSITSIIFERVKDALPDRQVRIRTIDLKQLDEAIKYLVEMPDRIAEAASAREN